MALESIHGSISRLQAHLQINFVNNSIPSRHRLIYQSQLDDAYLLAVSRPKHSNEVQMYAVAYLESHDYTSYHLPHLNIG